MLIYETFADGNQSLGKPSRADFLLRHGELLEAADGLRIVAYEDGFLDGAASLRAAHRRGDGRPMRSRPVRYPLSARAEHRAR